MNSQSIDSSSVFNFIRREILSEHSASAVAKRAGLNIPTVYRWLREEYSPDQSIAFEATLKAFGYRISIEPLAQEPPHDQTPIPPPVSRRKPRKRE